MLLGVASAVLASILFGSVFVPIKKFPPTDGFMTQFFMSLGGFLTSLVLHAALDFPPIFPLAIIGGALWCASNSVAFAIMNRLGMAPGILIWNTFSCCMGWATARYGLFGVPASVPNSVIMNYLGILLLLAGAVFYLFIKTNLDSPKADDNSYSPKEVEANLNRTPSEVSLPINQEVPPIERILALVGAVISGLGYGSMCTPVTYIVNHPELYDVVPSTSLAYLFSFFCGVLSTSTVILAVYSLVKKNRPHLPEKLVLPSLLSGIIFGLAMGGFFTANELLSQTIAYPICAMAPGLVASIWSVLYFKEITGKKNIYLLLSAYAFTIVGVGMVTISKEI